MSKLNDAKLNPNKLAKFLKNKTNIALVHMLNATRASVLKWERIINDKLIESTADFCSLCMYNDVVRVEIIECKACPLYYYYANCNFGGSVWNSTIEDPINKDHPKTKRMLHVLLKLENRLLIECENRDII